MRHFLKLALCGILTSGCGVVTAKVESAPEATVRRPIIDGTEDSSTTAVVDIDVRHIDGTFEYCSGALIAPGIALTAAHCFADPSYVSEVTVNTNLDARNPTGKVQALYRVNPAYEINQETGERRHDTALVFLKSGGVDYRTWPTLEIRQTDLTESDLYRTVRVVGYGQSTENVAETGGYRRSGFGTTVQFGNGAILVEGPNGQCYGDSGGPTLLTEEDGVERIIGISSFTALDLSGQNTCSGNWNMTVDDNFDFINYWLDLWNQSAEGRVRPICSEIGGEFWWCPT